MKMLCSNACTANFKSVTKNIYRAWFSNSLMYTIFFCIGLLAASRGCSREALVQASVEGVLRVELKVSWNKSVASFAAQALNSKRSFRSTKRNYCRNH